MEMLSKKDGNTEQFEMETFPSQWQLPGMQASLSLMNGNTRWKLSIKMEMLLEKHGNADEKNMERWKCLSKATIACHRINVDVKRNGDVN